MDFNLGILDSLSSQIAVIDHDGAVVAVNEAWARAVSEYGGYPRGCEQGANYFLLCLRAAQAGDEIAERVLLGLKAVQRMSSESFYCEYPCHSPGVNRWLSLRAFSLRTGPGSLVIVHDDITERVLAEKKRNESELRYRALLQFAPDAMVTIDKRDMVVTGANSEAQRLIGYTREELVGQSAAILIPPRFRLGRDILATLLQLSSGKDVYILRKDGVEVPVGMKLSTLAGDAELMLSIRDVTDLKRADSKFRDLLEAAPDPIVLVNSEGSIALVNGHALHAFGYGLTALIGKSITLLLPESEARNQAVYAAGVFATPTQAAMGTLGEMVGRRSDGSEFPVEISLSPLQTEAGIMVSVAIRDITERKRADLERLDLEIAAAASDAANRAKGAFLSMVSHEIRTPMNAILGYTQLMLRDRMLGGETRRNLEVVNRNGEHLLSLLNDVLDMAKIDAGTMEIRPLAFDLAWLLRGVEEIFQLKAREKDIGFHITRTGEPVRYLVGDESKIRQVILNLLGNSVKFTEAGRIDLIVDVQRQESGQLWLAVTVKDTGIGISETDQERLFQPFVQGQTTLASYGGTGLGLAISRRLIQLMGGSVSYTSRMGEGSQFRFSIPVETRDTAQAETPHEERHVLRVAGDWSPRILVAEDNDDNRLWLKKLLQSVGFQVSEAADGTHAIQQAEVCDPDLVLMDIHMPHTDGLEASRAIKERSPQTPILALTASTMEHDRRAALGAGADDFISKPCTTKELLAKIQKHLKLEYEMENDGDESTAVESGLASLAAELKKHPPEWVSKLLRATRSGSKDKMLELVDQFERQSDSLAAAELRSLVSRYEYDRLISILEEACRR